MRPGSTITTQTDTERLESGRIGRLTVKSIVYSEENPSRLTCHDWHSVGGVRQALSSQGAVREGAQVSGLWALEVARDGVYEFALRRWPVEADEPINAAIPGGKAITATEARLKIAPVSAFVESTGVDVRSAAPTLIMPAFGGPVSKDARAVTFQVRLKAGKTCLQTWFTDDKSTSWGAYYVYVRRL